jgi:integrase
MVGKTKFPVMDEAFLPKMIEVCDSDFERGLVYLLYYTGMHGSCLIQVHKENLVKEGPRIYIQWIRPKTSKTMRCLLPKDKMPAIEAFLEHPKKIIQGYNFILRRLGKRAGFDGISTMTFRHTFCINSMNEGYGMFLVQHRMGCTLDVVARNYTKMTEEQLARKNGGIPE